MKQKNFVIVRTVNGIKYASFIHKEINIKGYRCFTSDIYNLKKLLKNEKLFHRNTIIHTRTAHPGFVYKTLKKLESQGYSIINQPETIRLTSQKYLSCKYMLKNNLPCAETVKIKKELALDFVKKNLDKWGKVIVKPLTSKGQGEHAYCFWKENLNELKNILTIPSGEVICQEYIKYYRLSRVIVIGNKALSDCVFYDEPGKGWKCSVCLNPKIKLYKNPPEELLNLAEKTAQIFGSEISFIDIFSTEKGLVLNEINTACSLIIHERISKINISKHIAKYLLSKANKESA
ncbi:MAG: hypothetical protein CEN89_507 [Candidatus Berkelbacteria bacterium Licking1014_7]|uniref:ATP-grasp domain-containing protein n=1 Tax=Candidatus Berkelbacteria bacterium Licking1014_7 TaxID=2017147 RepID=A0A554LIN4_9BACT|nr:MAG: hypothetical protein CEN89_507 [Candidatus Berkelbacteria bacterium Licking1014_7]